MVAFHEIPPPLPGCPMKIALNYDTRKPLDSKGEIYGMEVATFDWFRAYFRYGTFDKVSLLVDEASHLDAIQKVADEAGLARDRLIALRTAAR